MKVRIGIPPYDTKGEPLIEMWAPWARSTSRITVYGLCLRLPFGRTLTVRGPRL